jgi:hypothetical protein
VVTDGERVGQRVVHRNVRPGVVPHDRRPVGRSVGGDVGVDPLIHPAVVPRRVLRGPIVGRIVDRVTVQHRSTRDVKPKRVQVAGRRRPDAGGKAELPERRGGIVETTDPGHGAEVVVEGSVLLHQQHDVLDIVQRTGTGRINRMRPFDDRPGQIRQQPDSFMLERSRQHISSRQPGERTRLCHVQPTFHYADEPRDPHTKRALRVGADNLGPGMLRTLGRADIDLTWARNGRAGTRSRRPCPAAGS